MNAPAVRMPPQPRFRYCRECGQPFYPQRRDQHFCKNACRMQRNDRERSQGRSLLPLILKWRLDRTKGALAELTRFADEIAEGERQRRRQHKAIRKQVEGEKV